MDGSEEIETDLEFCEIRMQKCKKTFEGEKFTTVSTLKMENVFHGKQSRDLLAMRSCRGKI